MDEQELEATLIKSGFRADSTMLGATQLSRKRHTALLSGLEKGDQPVSSDVADLIEHRERRTAITTMALGALVAPEQDSALTATLIAPWTLPSLPSLPLPATKQEAVVAPEPSASTPTPAVTPPVPAPASAPTAVPQEHKQRRWQPLQKFVQGLRPRRIPVLYQMSAVECGAACLAMLLSYYGRKTSVSEVRDRCNVGRDGLSALDIVKAARMYGMRVRAVALQENDFRLVTLPAIVHWEFNHFLIVERWTPTHVDLVDPALGRRRVTIAEFDNSFTGIVMMLEPGVQFDRNSTARHIRLRSFAQTYVKTSPKAFMQILGASLLLQLFGLALPVLTAVVVNTIIPFGLKDVLALLAIGLLLLMIAQLVTMLLRSLVLLYLQTRVDVQMMLGFVEQLLTLPLRFFQQRSSGDILSRLSSNIVIRDTIGNQLISTLLDGSFVVVYLIILLRISLLFCLCVVIIAVLQVTLLVSTNRLMHTLASRELVAQGKSNGYVAEALVGITTLKSAGAEHRALQQWSNLFFDQMNTSVRRSYAAALINTGMTTLQTFSPVALLVFGTLQVINGTLNVGTMLALVALATAFLTPLASLVSSGQRLQLVHSHLERVADIMEAEPEQDIATVQQPPQLTGQIWLEDVSFRYDTQSPVVLHDIYVKINAGQKVAIVGRTGSGKSTLGNLLLGMYLPTSGEIIYDNVPLRTLNYQAVRSQFGVVMQGSTIFNGSIRENIALNDPSMDMDRIIKVAKLAAIHDDIMQMPMEYETFVSEGGSALSGGQRQRLALARALANTPSLLLLDEATSALDVVTEKIIEQNLQKLQCTQIIIAHRLSTIRNADLILVVDRGTIVERGTHESLLERNGYYAKLIQSQLASGEIKVS
jgi:ATP-binding cassette subfamily B protein